MRVRDLIEQLQKLGLDKEVVINGQEVHGVEAYLARRKETYGGFVYTPNPKGQYKVVTLTYYEESSDGKMDQSKYWYGV